MGKMRLREAKRLASELAAGAWRPGRVRSNAHVRNYLHGLSGGALRNCRAAGGERQAKTEGERESLGWPGITFPISGVST